MARPSPKLGDDALGELPRWCRAIRSRSASPTRRSPQAVELAGQIASAGLPRPLEIAIAAADDPDGFSLRAGGLRAAHRAGPRRARRSLGALARVLAAAPPEAAAAARLDLRFADQVVLRGTPSSTEAADATGKHAGAAPVRARCVRRTDGGSKTRGGEMRGSQGRSDRRPGHRNHEDLRDRGRAHRERRGRGRDRHASVARPAQGRGGGHRRHRRLHQARRGRSGADGRLRDHARSTPASPAATSAASTRTASWR